MLRRMGVGAIGTRACALLAALTFSAPGAAQQPLRVGSLEAAGGEKVSGQLGVTLADGSVLEIPVSIVNGAAPGPVIALVAGEHGTEYAPILALQRLLAEIDPATLRGALILVHIANPPAFFARRLARGDPDDLNEMYPGDPGGTVSERIAWVITRDVVEPATHLINMHAGDGNERLGAYAYVVPTGDSVLDATTRDLAVAYGMPRVVLETGIHANEEGTRYYLDTYALSRGKPAFLPEIGGFSSTDSTFVSAHVAGVRSVLAHLGMTDGVALRPEPVVWFDESVELRAGHTGLWQPLVAVGEIVAAGAVLGTITDPAGRLLEEVRAPYHSEVLSVIGTPPIRGGQTVIFIGRRATLIETGTDTLAVRVPAGGSGSRAGRRTVPAASVAPRISGRHWRTPV